MIEPEFSEPCTYISGSHYYLIDIHKNIITVPVIYALSASTHLGEKGAPWAYICEIKVYYSVG